MYLQILSTMAGNKKVSYNGIYIYCPDNGTDLTVLLKMTKTMKNPYKQHKDMLLCYAYSKKVPTDGGK